MLNNSPVGLAIRPVGERKNKININSIEEVWMHRFTEKSYSMKQIWMQK